MEQADSTGTTDAGQTLRSEALSRIKKKRDFWTHAFIYVLVNSMLVGVWAITGTDNLFWPIFPILGWGIGLAANAWDVFMRKPITEDEIRREEQRLRERGTAGGP